MTISAAIIFANDMIEHFGESQGLPNEPKASLINFIVLS